MKKWKKHLHGLNLYDEGRVKEHPCALTMVCLSAMCPSGIILWHQPQQCPGDTEAPRMILSWNISFLPTPTTSCEIINSSIHPYLLREARHPHAAPQRTVGKALPECLTLSLDYFMSPTPWILSHSVWIRDLSACPAWVPSFLQYWKSLELDKSEIPKLNILPFPLVCGLPLHSLHKCWAFSMFLSLT